MADVQEEHVHTHPGGTANPLGATYAHTVIGEDRVINGLLRKTAYLFETMFAGETGLDLPYPKPENREHMPEWMKQVRVDLTKLRAYAQAVQKDAEDYVAGLSDIDLDRKIDFGRPGVETPSVAFVLSGYIIGHIHSHTGEIAVLKGLHGAKGYAY